MALIENFSQLRENIAYFQIQSGSSDHRDYVKFGICFVAYDSEGQVAFAPSRFLGYQGNSFEHHARNAEKDGKDTTPVISGILGSSAIEHSDLESHYQSYCERLGFAPNPKGNFSVVRKYWDCRGRI